MSTPQISERHQGRTYRSVWLPANLWATQAGSESIGNNYILMKTGEKVGCHWVPPHDLDPSKDIYFRVHFFANITGLTLTFAVLLRQCTNDGTDLGYDFDPSSTTALTTAIPGKVVSAGMAGNTVVTAAGKLTRASTTIRNWATGLYLTCDSPTTQVYILGLEIAYVPLTAGVTGASAVIAAPWAT